MRLRIVTPLSVVVDEENVSSLRAEDASGGFGLMSGHTDFLTSLEVSVVSWKGQNGASHYCAARRGVLTMTGGVLVSIATREAVPGDDYSRLDREVLERFRRDLEAERTEHVESTRLQLSAIRQIMRRLRPVTGEGAPG